MTEQTFTQFMSDIDDLIEADFGLSSSDFADVNFMDMYISELTPKEAYAEWRIANDIPEQM